jgi:hypothetical protein
VKRKKRLDPDLGVRVEFLREVDVPEFERVKQQLVKVLKRLGGYEPGVDEFYVEEIARASIYLRHLEVFLDSDKATDVTYMRVTDARLKLRSNIDTAMHHLAIRRRDRLANKTENDIRKELQAAILRGLKHGER